jgi:hypothetical protein
MFRQTIQPNFEACPHKKIIFETKEDHIVGASVDCPKTQDSEEPLSVKADPMNNRHHYVTTETDGKYYPRAYYKGPKQAHRELAAAAGEILCANCPYFVLRPVEVAQLRAQRAEEDLAVAELELRRREALAMRDEVIAEIEAAS